MSSKRKVEVKWKDGPSKKPKKLPMEAFSDPDAVEPEPEVKKTADELISSGQAAALSSDFSRALQCWGSALAMSNLEDATRATVLEQKAQVLLEVNKPFEAIVAAQESINLRPNWIVAKRTLSRAQFVYGDAELAVQTMEVCLVALNAYKGSADDISKEEIEKELDEMRDVVRQKRKQEELIGKSLDWRVRVVDDDEL
eukprot:Rmarinus@m.19081